MLLLQSNLDAAAEVLDETQDTLRVAYFASELGREGPGLLLRDLLRDEEDNLVAALDALAATEPDLLGLSGIDYDYAGHALRALQLALRDRGLDLRYTYASRPNTGIRSRLDLNGDGRVGDPQDAQGYGSFPGAQGLAVLSRWPIAVSKDLTPMLWKDLPFADLPRHQDGALFPSTKAIHRQRLSAVAHWRIDLATPLPLRLTILHAQTPVFDGAEDRNGRRNADELRLVQAGLEATPAEMSALVMGTLNVDPFDGPGRHSVLTNLLSDPRLQDPTPSDHGGIDRSVTDGAINAGHRNDPAQDTANFREDRPRDPGNLRVGYVLPDRDLRVVATGLEWPASGRRAIVWVDLSVPY